MINVYYGPQGEWQVEQNFAASGRTGRSNWCRGALGHSAQHPPNSTPACIYTHTHTHTHNAMHKIMLMRQPDVWEQIVCMMCHKQHMHIVTIHA